MQGWGKGKKILAVVGGLFVLGAIGNATSPPDNVPKAQASSSSNNTSVKSESPLITAPNPEPIVEPTPASQPVTPPPTPVVVQAPAPAPTPQPEAICTPGYSPCIAPGSDVDCAGGSGNGPRYVSGPVQVTGSDPYGLDRDGDGIGCE
jgi:hypothetical protein